MKDIIAVPLSKVCTDDYSKAQEIGVPALRGLAASENKFGMYIQFSNPGQCDFREFFKAAPYLCLTANTPVVMNGFGFFLFDHEDDARYALDMTVGNSGPNQWNEYDGPARVYAVICDQDGRILDENSDNQKADA